MNTKYQFLIIAAVVLMASGCRVPPQPVLSASPKTFEFEAAGGSETFEVTSNLYWDISGQNMWLTVDPDSHKGSFKVTITAQPNTTTEIRPCTLKIAAAGTDVRDVSVIISQKAVTAASGTQGDPFIVNSVATLQKVGTGTDGWTRDKHYRQTANIDLNDVTNWTPIGNLSSTFTGSYDGGGYSIANLTISGTTNYMSLFGNIGSGGAVRNVALRNVSINSTNEEVGGIAGANHGTIENCYVTGTISGKGTVGGVTGNNVGSVIKNCYTTCDVAGSETRIGGIAGSCWNIESASNIAYCYATGKISGTDFVGGIVGEHYSSDDTVERCVALNHEVSASDGVLVGRIAGRSLGILTDNYSRPDMTMIGNTPTSNVTGIHGADTWETNTHGASSGTWWSGTLGWSTTLWTFEINRLPHLKTTTKELFKQDQDPEVN